MSTFSLNLEITKIGDLLLKNKITNDKNKKPIENIELVIPDYQRPYKWTEKNVIQLLDDILNAKSENKETYRVGTLILYNKEIDNKIEYEIVDGQQRIITFSLLLRALDAGEINFLGQSLANNPHNVTNIPGNFLVLQQRINKIDDNEKPILLEYVKNNCELIVIITNDLSEAFQFFDSQNARGKKLYPHDLLKAYHLREMNDLDVNETEKVIKGWEELNQGELSLLFSDYLHRIKEWIKGNRAWELNEHDIHKFKGITRQDNFPYAQFYKGAFAYADTFNSSSIPFVSGMHKLNYFQLDTPIVAGKPFFDYAKHYFEILKDIQDNDKYKGYFINDNDIVKTLDLRTYKIGSGNLMVRLLFDTSILLYVDRFCPERPSKTDLEMLDRFVVFAFVWAYSLRAQYQNVSKPVVLNFIMGTPAKELRNSFNIYKIITEADSPVSLMSMLFERITPLPNRLIKAKKDNINNTKYKYPEGTPEKEKIYLNYLYWFKKHQYLEDENDN